MRIATQTQDQLVLKDGGITDWLSLFNGIWALIIALVAVYMILDSINFSTFFSDLNNVVNFLAVIVPALILGIGMKFLLWASWATLDIQKSTSQVSLSRRTALKQNKQLFSIADLASIELTKLWQRQRSRSVLLRQIVLVFADGTKLSFGHESDASNLDNIAHSLAKFLEIPYQEVKPPLTRWGKKLPPYDKFPR